VIFTFCAYVPRPFLGQEFESVMVPVPQHSVHRSSPCWDKQMSFLWRLLPNSREVLSAVYLEPTHHWIADSHWHQNYQFVILKLSNRQIVVRGWQDVHLCVHRKKPDIWKIFSCHILLLLLKNNYCSWRWRSDYGNESHFFWSLLVHAFDAQEDLWLADAREFLRNCPDWPIADATSVQANHLTTR
jgi:hypothetical protein